MQMFIVNDHNFSSEINDPIAQEDNILRTDSDDENDFEILSSMSKGLR